jgi:hypothetical protein
VVTRLLLTATGKAISSRAHCCCTSSGALDTAACKQPGAAVAYQSRRGQSPENHGKSAHTRSWSCSLHMWPVNVAAWLPQKCHQSSRRQECWCCARHPKRNERGGAVTASQCCSVSVCARAHHSPVSAMPHQPHHNLISTGPPAAVAQAAWALHTSACKQVPLVWALLPPDAPQPANPAAAGGGLHQPQGRHTPLVDCCIPAARAGPKTAGKPRAADKIPQTILAACLSMPWGPVCALPAHAACAQRLVVLCRSQLCSTHPRPTHSPTQLGHPLTEPAEKPSRRHAPNTQIMPQPMPWLVGGASQCPAAAGCWHG